jgi:glutamate synthase (ferredoxin)
MTGGRVVVLGSTGRNFAAGMSGGIAYVLDEAGDINMKLNKEMILVEALTEETEVNEVLSMIRKHVKYTNSPKGHDVLNNWDEYVTKFVKIIPKDFKRMMQAIEDVKRSGLSGEEALLAAFTANMSDASRVSGS